MNAVFACALCSCERQCSYERSVRTNAQCSCERSVFACSVNAAFGKHGKHALDTTSTSCMQTAADHEATVKSRSEELAAIADAKKILEDSSSGVVSQTNSLIQIRAGSQLKKRSSFARLRS